MKKHILALAVAAASVTAVPAAFAQSAYANAQKSAGETTFYGNIQYAIEAVDDSENGSKMDSYDNGSRLGIRHEHKITQSITGFAKVEVRGLGLDDKSGKDSAFGRLDEAYIGVSGDFGKVWIGSDDTTYETLIQKVPNYFESGRYNLYAGGKTGEGDLLQYESPLLPGGYVGGVMKFYGAVGFESGQDKNGGANKLPYQLGMSYALDGFALNVAMDSNDGFDDNRYSQRRGSNNTYGMNMEFTPLENLIFGTTYSYKNKDSSEKVSGLKQSDVYGRYTVGKTVFATSYERMETQDYGSYDVAIYNSDGMEVGTKAVTYGSGETISHETFTLQALHNVSESLLVYSEVYFTNYKSESLRGDATSLVVGARYSF